MRMPRFTIRTTMMVVASIAIGLATAPKTRVGGTIVDGASPPVVILVARATWDVVGHASAIGLCVFVVLAILVRLASKAGMYAPHATPGLVSSPIWHRRSDGAPPCDSPG